MGINLDVLVTFEAIRRIFGHVITLDDHEVEAVMYDGPEDACWEVESFDALVGYARRLREKLADCPDRPQPVLPFVDISRLGVWHETCTGRTRLEIQCGDQGGQFGLWVQRREAPLNMADGRDLALWSLVKSLGGLSGVSFGGEGKFAGYYHSSVTGEVTEEAAAEAAARIMAATACGRERAKQLVDDGIAKVGGIQPTPDYASELPVPEWETEMPDGA